MDRHMDRIQTTNNDWTGSEGNTETKYTETKYTNTNDMTRNR